MSFQDFEYLKNNLKTSGLMGSDSSLANILLLQEKYNTELKIVNDTFFRYYSGSENRSGYAFPLAMKNAGEDWLKFSIDYILKDAKDKNRIPAFCLISQEQKSRLDLCFEKYFPGHRVAWKTNRDDCDYLYLRESLASLEGSRYQKKRNHVSRFNRIYGNNWKFKLYPQNDIAEDILKISQKWYEEKEGEKERALRLEHQSIEDALKNTELLQLFGGVLYINDQPAAFTLAAPISPDVLDVIYEKAIAEHEKNGVYAVINQQFAKQCPSFLYLNREEDMGIEGIRKAKLSYKPDIILDKFYGRIE